MTILIQKQIKHQAGRGQNQRLQPIRLATARVRLTQTVLLIGMSIMRKNYFQTTDGLFIIAAVGLIAAIYFPFAKRIKDSEYAFVNYIIIGLIVIFSVGGIVTAYFESRNKH